MYIFGFPMYCTYLTTFYANHDTERLSSTYAVGNKANHIFVRLTSQSKDS